MPFTPLFRLAKEHQDCILNPYAFSPKREKGYSLLPPFIGNALAQGRKFTAKSERDVICGKTLPFFHEVITGPW